MSALGRNERGAIMVLGLFMAIFATGCLYYLVGIGEAIAQRERMQDAADAAAFSSAVLHARGMNVVALLNMTMAALLAVLIALKLVEAVAYVGIAFAIASAFPTSGGSLVAVAPLTQVAINARNAHERAKPAIQTSLRALRIAARGVRIVMPWVAQARTVQTVVAHYDPPASFGFAVPGRITLPTRDGSYDDLCKKASEYVGDLVAAPLGPANELFDISEVMGGVLDAGSGWLCESEGGRRPAVEHGQRIEHPLLPRARACEEYAQRANADLAEHARLCEQGERETAAAKAAVDPGTGDCIDGSGHDCRLEGLYELRAALAQRACAPRATGDEQLSAFTWQTRTFTRRYLWFDGQWEVDTEIVEGTERYLFRGGARPCGTPTASIGPEWSAARRRDGLLVPICHNVEAPSGPPPLGGNTLDVVHTEVLQIFGCEERVRVRREIEGEQGELSASGEEGQEMAPQLIAEGAVLGEEDFQIRAVVFGSRSQSSLNAMLANLTSPEAVEEERHAPVWQKASELGRIAIAQAEFYFDDANAASDDLLWSMKWTARLRRFRLAEAEPAQLTADDVSDALLHGADDVLGTIDDACAVFSTEESLCEQLDLFTVSDLIAH